MSKNKKNSQNSPQNKKSRLDNVEVCLICAVCVVLGMLVGSVWQSSLDEKAHQRSHQIKTVKVDNYFEGLRYRSNGSGDFERRNQVDTAVVLWCLKNGNVFDVCAVNNVEPQKHIATFDEKTNQVLKGTQSGDMLVCKDGVPVENLRLKVLEQETIKGK